MAISGVKLVRRLFWCWPGLPQLWRSGSWLGLAIALGFAVVADLLLLCTVVWDEVATRGLLRFSWLIFGVSWLTTLLLYGQRETAALETPVAVPKEDLFPEATTQYLRGNWFEAETLCRRLLRREERDLEARLLLSSVLRRSNRVAEAWEELDRMQKLAGSERWAREIAAERQRMAETVGAAARAKLSDKADETGQDSSSDVAAQDVTSPRGEAENRAAA